MTEAEVKKGGGWFRWVKLVFSFGLGLGLLVLIFHDVDMDRFLGAIRDVDKAWWAVCFASFVCLHVSRAWRWGRIVNQVHRVSFRQVFSINSVGFLAIQALPLLVRTRSWSTRASGSTSRSTGSRRRCI